MQSWLSGPLYHSLLPVARALGGLENALSRDMECMQLGVIWLNKKYGVIAFYLKVKSVWGALLCVDALAWADRPAGALIYFTFLRFLRLIVYLLNLMLAVAAILAGYLGTSFLFNRKECASLEGWIRSTQTALFLILDGHLFFNWSLIWWFGVFVRYLGELCVR